MSDARPSEPLVEKDGKLPFRVDIKLGGMTHHTVRFATREEAEAYVRSFDEPLLSAHANRHAPTPS